MKKLIIIIVILMLSSIVAFAELSDESKVDIELLRTKHSETEIDVEAEIEALRSKHYGTGSLICIDDQYIITWEPPPPIELVDIEIKGMKFKGWEIWINDKPYYVVLLEKED